MVEKLNTLHFRPPDSLAASSHLHLLLSQDFISPVQEKFVSKVGAGINSPRGAVSNLQAEPSGGLIPDTEPGPYIWTAEEI